MVPPELDTKVIVETFPEAKNVYRLKPRQCYIRFKKVKDTMKARIKLSEETIAGHKVIAKFRKDDGESIPWPEEVGVVKEELVIDRENYEEDGDN